MDGDELTGDYFEIPFGEKQEFFLGQNGIKKVWAKAAASTTPTDRFQHLVRHPSVIIHVHYSHAWVHDSVG